LSLELERNRLSSDYKKFVREIKKNLERQIGIAETEIGQSER
jgi:hypothetical protein